MEGESERGKRGVRKITVTEGAEEETEKKRKRKKDPTGRYRKIWSWREEWEEIDKEGEDREREE